MLRGMNSAMPLLFLLFLVAVGVLGVLFGPDSRVDEGERRRRWDGVA